MKAESDRDRQLDELLRLNYDELRPSSSEQRQSVLDRVFNEPRPASPFAPPRAVHWRRWLVAAACVMALFAAWSWRPAARDGLAFGIEDVPLRLAEVQSLRLRGWIWVPWFNGKPPMRLPIETLVKRPGKFRATTSGASHAPDGKPQIVQFVEVCDGQHQWQIGSDHKVTFSRSLSALDALLCTEALVQTAAEVAVLGPPDAAYRKVGTESQNGRRLDVYEARFPLELTAISQFKLSGAKQFTMLGDADAIGGGVVARVWIDPKEGLPVRVLRSEVEADGKTSPVMELDDIAVNVPLDDELFKVDAAKQAPQAGGLGPHVPREASRAITGTTTGDAQQPTNTAPALDLAPNGGAYSATEKLEPWQAFRISDNAAVMIWRRSAPAQAPELPGQIKVQTTLDPPGEVAREKSEMARPLVMGGVRAPDWLSNLTMVVPDSAGGRVLRHHWIYQSQSADHWNWSLVVPADGKSLGRSQIRLRLRGDKFVGTVDLLPLRLREDDLRQLLRAAHDAMLPKSSPEISLPYLQAVARKLASAKSE